MIPLNELNPCSHEDARIPGTEIWIVGVKLAEEILNLRAGGEVDFQLARSDRVPQMRKELHPHFHGAINSFRRTPMQGKFR